MGLMESLKRLFGGAKEAAKEAAEKAEPYVEKAKEAVEEVAEKAEPYVEKAKETLGLSEDKPAADAPSADITSSEAAADSEPEGDAGNPESG